MPEIGTSGSMSGDGKRSAGLRAPSYRAHPRLYRRRSLRRCRGSVRLQRHLHRAGGEFRWLDTSAHASDDSTVIDRHRTGRSFCRPQGRLVHYASRIGELRTSEWIVIQNLGTLRRSACDASPRWIASPLLIQNSGISNRHLIPSGAKTRSTTPPSSYGTSSRIRLVP